MKTLRYLFATILFVFLCGVSAYAQSASPTITFFSIDEDAEVTMTEGETCTCQAPLEIACVAGVESEEGWTAQCEWRIFDTAVGETETILTRFEENTQYTLTKSGSYGIKLYITFTGDGGDKLEYESELFTITISESDLDCPDGFSPNGDGINDVFKFTYKSIVKFEAAFFNRWGKKLHSMTLKDIDEGWDGRQGGKYVRDGVYFLKVNAVGSDGVEYKIKKAVNVLKGFREEGGIE